MVKIILLSGEQNHRCCYCGNSMTYHNFCSPGPIPPNAMTRDHVVPKSYGGCGYYENIVIACSQCNSLRGNLDANIFHRLMEEWKKRYQDFAKTWHYVSRADLWRFKMEVYLYQNLHLKHQRKRDVRSFNRYEKFKLHHGQSLAASRRVHYA